MRDPNLNSCPEKERHQQCWQDSGLSGETKKISQTQSWTDAFACSINFAIYMWDIDTNARLKEGSRLLKWDASARSYTSLTRITLSMTKCAVESKWPSTPLKTLRQWLRNISWTTAAQLALPKPSCKALCQEEEGGAENGRGGRIMSRSGQAFPLAAPRRQPWIEWLTGNCHFVSGAPVTRSSRDRWEKWWECCFNFFLWSVARDW